MAHPSSDILRLKGASQSGRPQEIASSDKCSSERFVCEIFILTHLIMIDDKTIHLQIKNKIFDDRESKLVRNF